MTIILICYDGSSDSRAAIEHAAELVKGQPVTVLTVWEPFAQVIARTATGGLALGAGTVDVAEVDEATRKGAEQRGAELAREHGLDAHPRTCSQETTTAGAILGEAAGLGASAILMGSRGLTGLKSVLLGSVSHAVIQHADRAVIVVPSPEVAASRERARRERHG